MALFQKATEQFAKGLSRTREKFVGSLKSILSGKSIDDNLLDDLEAKLIEADVGVSSAVRICDDLREARNDGRIEKGDDVLAFLKKEIKKYWPESDRSIHFCDKPPTVIIVAGINGAGKTTSIAKLAYLFKQQGKKVCLAAADTFRAAAVEQLTVWADRLDVDIIKGSGSDPAAVVYDACDAAIARNADVLLVDTAGRLHTQDNLMRELIKIRDVVAKKIPGAPHEVIQVLDATTGQNAINQAKAFQQAIDVTGIFLAKLDGTAKGGVVIAIRNEVNLPVKFIGIGEGYEDIEPFDPETFVEALFAEQAGPPAESKPAMTPQQSDAAETSSAQTDAQAADASATDAPADQPQTPAEVTRGSRILTRAVTAILVCLILGITAWAITNWPVILDWFDKITTDAK